MICLCSFLWTKILLERTLITLHSMLLCIRAHLSFKRSDSTCLSSGDISGLILSSLGSDLALEKSRDTSILRLSLTSIVHGLKDCS